MKSVANPNSKKLQEIYDSLPAEARKSLLDYAEYLLSRAGSTEPIVQEKLDIPRPENESVIAAIKRVQKTYPMIERSKVFHETSSLMTEHVMQGREASEVIDDIQALFEKHYQEFLDQNNS